MLMLHADSSMDDKDESRSLVSVRMRLQRPNDGGKAQTDSTAPWPWVLHDESPTLLSDDSHSCFQTTMVDHGPCTHHDHPRFTLAIRQCTPMHRQTKKIVHEVLAVFACSCVVCAMMLFHC